MLPGSWLPCGNDALGRPTAAYDVAKYSPKFESEDDYCKLFSITLQMMDALAADLDEVRSGVVFLAACKGIGMAQYVQISSIVRRNAVVYNALDVQLAAPSACDCH